MDWIFRMMKLKFVHYATRVFLVEVTVKALKNHQKAYKT